MINIWKLLTGRRKPIENTAITKTNIVNEAPKYKYTVVSYLFNSYDRLHEVKSPDADVRYILITDDKKLKSRTWEIHHYTEYPVLANMPDMLGVLYYIKFHPFDFCDTGICFTVDASVSIIKSLNKLYEDFVHSKSEYGISIHPYRSNVYDELHFWKTVRGLPLAEVNAQKHLFGKTFYNKYVLFQATIILRKNGKVATAIDDLTWAFLKLTSTDKCVSRLDQTILTYVIATYMSNATYFLFSQDIMSSSYMNWIKHGTNEVITIDEKYRIPPSVFGKKLIPYRIE